MTTTNGKKRPVRVFLDGQDYSTLLIQAGTHQITSRYSQSLPKACSSSSSD